MEDWRLKNRKRGTLEFVGKTADKSSATAGGITVSDSSGVPSMNSVDLSEARVTLSTTIEVMGREVGVGKVDEPMEEVRVA
jgi:hypothetical protein